LFGLGEVGEMTERQIHRHTQTGLCYCNIDSCRGTVASFMESLKVMIAVNVRFSNDYILPDG